MGEFLNVDPLFHSSYILLSGIETPTFIKAKDFMKKRDYFRKNNDNRNFGGQKIKCYRMEGPDRNIRPTKKTK